MQLPTTGGMYTCIPSAVPAPVRTDCTTSDDVEVPLADDIDAIFRMLMLDEMLSLDIEKCLSVRLVDEHFCGTK